MYVEIVEYPSGLCEIFFDREVSLNFTSPRVQNFCVANVLFQLDDKRKSPTGELMYRLTASGGYPRMMQFESAVKFCEENFPREAAIVRAWSEVEHAGGEPRRKSATIRFGSTKPQSSELKPQSSELKPQSSELKPQSSELHFLYLSSYGELWANQDCGGVARKRTDVAAQPTFNSEPFFYWVCESIDEEAARKLATAIALSILPHSTKWHFLPHSTKWHFTATDKRGERGGAGSSFVITNEHLAKAFDARLNCRCESPFKFELPFEFNGELNKHLLRVFSLPTLRFVENLATRINASSQRKVEDALSCETVCGSPFVFYYKFGDRTSRDTLQKYVKASVQIVEQQYGPPGSLVDDWIWSSKLQDWVFARGHIDYVRA